MKGAGYMILKIIGILVLSIMCVCAYALCIVSGRSSRMEEEDW